MTNTNEIVENALPKNRVIINGKLQSLYLKVNNIIYKYFCFICKRRLSGTSALFEHNHCKNHIKMLKKFEIQIKIPKWLVQCTHFFCSYT